MARGAVQAQTAAGKKMFIAGADADAANVNYVCEGKQAVEVLKEIRPLAERAAQVAAALLGKLPVVAAELPRAEGNQAPVISVPVHLVTADNAWKLVVESGFH